METLSERSTAETIFPAGTAFRSEVKNIWTPSPSGKRGFRLSPANNPVPIPWKPRGVCPSIAPPWFSITTTLLEPVCSEASIHRGAGSGEGAARVGGTAGALWPQAIAKSKKNAKATNEAGLVFAGLFIGVRLPVAALSELVWWGYWAPLEV